MKNYNWGILAPGRIANNFAAGLATLPNAVKYAVGSREIGRAKAFADKHGFMKAYGSYAELAADPDVDAVYVATPHPWHEEAAVLCMNAGKAVICEKPFAATAKQAESMIACARGNGVFLMEAMWTRFLPTICKTRELIDGGAIGKVRRINAEFAFRAERDPKSRLFAPDYAGGSLLDVGVYNLSFARMIFKQPPEYILSKLYIGSSGVDETADVTLIYGGGRSASLYSAIRVSTAQDASIYGEDGYIKLPSYWHSDTVILKNADGEREIKLPFEASGFQYEAAEVMRCLDAGLLESPVMPLGESLEILETADKIRRDNGLRYPFE